MREHRADERGPEPAPARHLAVQHSNACELADPARQNRVREEAYGERGKDEHDRGMWRVHRLVDHSTPGECARDDGSEIQSDCNSDPFPLHGAKRVADGVPAWPAPPE